MADKDKKYYWLKLKRDFFKRHDIRIIEAMPNGKDYILFYLKLLCESVDHDGNLRFSENIPYNESMLATITNTNVDIVRSAVKVFTELGMMEVMDDGTYYMTEVNKMIGSASQDEHTRETTRMRVQAYRERQKQALLNDPVTVTLHVTESKSKSKSKSIEKELDNDDYINNKLINKLTNFEKMELEAECKNRGFTLDTLIRSAEYCNKDGIKNPYGYLKQMLMDERWK